MDREAATLERVRRLLEQVPSGCPMVVIQRREPDATLLRPVTLRRTAFGLQATIHLSDEEMTAGVEAGYLFALPYEIGGGVEITDKARAVMLDSKRQPRVMQAGNTLIFGPSRR
ncbi:MAG: hypothetical protein RLO50_20475 [Azospirillaceae bacterium]